VAKNLTTMHSLHACRPHPSSQLPWHPEVLRPPTAHRTPPDSAGRRGGGSRWCAICRHSATHHAWSGADRAIGGVVDEGPASTARRCGHDPAGCRRPTPRWWKCMHAVAPGRALRVRGVSIQVKSRSSSCWLIDSELSCCSLQVGEGPVLLVLADRFRTCLFDLRL